MEREEICRTYGIGEDSGIKLQTREYPGLFEGPLAEAMPGEEEGKTLFAFISIEMVDARERNMPLGEFAEKRIGLHSEGVAEPVMGVRHYMDRVGVVRLAPGEAENLAQAMRKYPFRIFAAYGDDSKLSSAADGLVNFWKGAGLRGQTAMSCAEKVMDLGAEFIHVTRDSRSFSVNRLTRE